MGGRLPFADSFGPVDFTGTARPRAGQQIEIAQKSGQGVEGATAGHQGGGSHDSVSMSFDDGAVDACGEAKIIGVDDQTAHRASLAGRASRAGAIPLTVFSRVPYTRTARFPSREFPTTQRLP